MLAVGLWTGLVVMFCWGIGTFLQSIPTRRIGTLKTQFISNLLGYFSAFIAILLFFNVLEISLVNFVLLFIAGICIVLGLYFVYTAIEIGELAIVSPITSSNAVITVVLSFLLLNERTRLIPLVLVFTGLVLTAADIRKLRHIRSAKGVRQALIAMLFLGINAFLYGIVNKDITILGLHSAAANPINAFVFSILINDTLFILFAAIKRQVPSFKEFTSDNNYLYLLATTSLFAVAWIVYNYGLANADISLVAPITSLSPAITIILAVVFFKEKLVNNQKLGIIILLTGLFLISV